MLPISKNISLSHEMSQFGWEGKQSEFYNISRSQGRDGRLAPRNVERFSIAVSSQFFMKEFLTFSIPGVAPAPPHSSVQISGIAAQG